MIEAQARPLLAYTTLFADICALKRIRRAGSAHSVATALFFRAWHRIAALDDPGDVADETAAAALVASRLGAIDGGLLSRCGLSAPAVRDIMLAAFDLAATMLDESIRARLRDAVPWDADLAAPLDLPSFVHALAAQPRAGATAPGLPRLVLEPAESHAEHCLAVSVLATLVAPRYGTRGDRAFLLGLTHHLHNAMVPDSGFAGEVLLGDALDSIVRHSTACALAELPGALAERVRDVRERLLPAAAEPEARAFHAADVLDRVLQVRHYASVAAFDVSHALRDLDLVHAGPVQHFHRCVLGEAGLA